MKWLTKAPTLLAGYLAVPGMMLAASGGATIPFELYRGYILIVKGSIGEMNRLNFVIDTGSAPSLVDQRIARKLGLAGSPAQDSTLTQKVSIRVVAVPNLHLGPTRIERVEAVAGDLSFLERALGIRVDALIGMDVLGLSSFTIDYESKKITFGPVDTSLNSVPYDPGLPYLVVHLRIREQLFRLLVDTGTSGLVLFERSLRDNSPGIRIVGREAWSSMGGEARVARVELLDARLGSTRWHRRRGFMLERSAGPSAEIDGLLGMDALNPRRVAFDFARKTLGWEQ